jgi:phosphohistidine phosphatase SixA
VSGKEMKIILLRHATRARGDSLAEKRLPLTPVGEAESRARAEELLKRGLRPELYYTSCFAHARQTGEILRDAVGGDPPARLEELCTLTPHYQGPRPQIEPWRSRQLLEAIAHEAAAIGAGLDQFDVVAFVLHRPRLQQLAASMASRDESRFDGLEYSEGVCLSAVSLQGFLDGRGTQDGTMLRRRRP